MKDSPDHTEAICHIPPGRQEPCARNACTRSCKQLMRSIEQFGFTNPVLIYEDCTILARHARVVAAREMGLETVPCRLVSSTTSSEGSVYCDRTIRLWETYARDEAERNFCGWSPLARFLEAVE